MSHYDNDTIDLEPAELEQLTEHLKTLNASIDKLRSAIQTLNISPPNTSTLEASVDAADLEEITKLFPDITLH